MRLRDKSKQILLMEFEGALATLGRLADEGNWVRVRRKDGTIVLAYIPSDQVPVIIGGAIDVIREVHERYHKRGIS